MTKTKFMAVAAVTVALSGCGLPGTFYAEPFSQEMIKGSDFNAELARAYQQRVNNTIEADDNWILAGMYTMKGEAAADGQTVLPWDHTTYQEQPTYRTGVPSDRAAKYNLAGLRSELMSALDNGGRSNQPYACAQAQVHYDWLIDETFQDTPPSQVNEEDKISVDLKRFLRDCAGVKQVKKVAPAAATEWVIYFGWDRSNLTAEAQRVVDSVVSTVSQMTGKALSVVGYTDTSGSMRYNSKLSKKRAMNVANALSSKGVANIHTAARGESNLAKMTADGVREPLNRRAVITLK
ncbi:MAG: OmpA family protein [Pseudomonadota bacterium]